MLIPGYKDYKKPTTSKGYDCENETFTKFGQEIKIHDFIQAGRENTETTKLVESAGGLGQLKEKLKNIPSAETTIDLNMDPIHANHLLKAAQTSIKELKRQENIRIEAERAKKEAELEIKKQKEEMIENE